VDVQNASGAGGRSTAVSQALVDQGWTRAVRDTTQVAKSPTKLVYPTGKQAEAKELAGALGLPESALSESAAGGTHLVLTVGTDWTTGTTFPAAGGSTAPPPPAPTAMPTSAVAQNAQDDANQCMEVNPEKHNGKPIYIWSGSTPPDVPQP
jgi:hypothetical protein